LPGTPVLGFLACAIIFRRSAFEAVGGFESRVVIGGEEEWLACELAAADWEIRYLPEVVAHHDPPGRGLVAREERRRIGLRTTLWFSWLRRPASSAFRRTVHLARTTPTGSRDVACILGCVQFAVVPGTAAPSGSSARRVDAAHA